MREGSTVLITGAAGNLGGHLARHLLGGPHRLRLLVHRTEPPADLTGRDGVEVVHADLARPETLADACAGVGTVVHFAGVLFAPRPERFLAITNTVWAENLIRAAIDGHVERFILVSFPHVEGETTPEHPALGRLDGNPTSVHARTRLEAEKRLLALTEGTDTTAVILRPGMIYAEGVKMIDAARWLARHRLLAVWPRPTWVHMLALPDFNEAVTAAIEKPGISGIYNLGDDDRVTLQGFLDRACEEWGERRPWRFPAPLFFAAGAACEFFAALFGTAAPLTRDFIRIGMASYHSDTSRMKRELLPTLRYPTLESGLKLLGAVEGTRGRPLTSPQSKADDAT